MSELITKIEAARRQLQAAIEMFFSRGDAVAIGTLAYNALEISSTLAGLRGEEDWTAFKKVAEQHQTTPKEVRDLFHKPRNFFKHADRDPDDVLESWTDDDVAHLLAFTVIQFGEVAERSVEMWSALIWYYAALADVKAPEALRDLVEEFSYVRKLGREQQLAQRALVLAELLKRAK